MGIKKTSHINRVDSDSDDTLKSLGIDDRKAERLSISLPVHYCMQIATGQLQGRSLTTDLSGSGIKFSVPWMVPKGVRCNLNLVLPKQSEPILLTGEVIWCRPHADRHAEQFEVGVALSVTEESDETAFAHYCHFVASQLLKKYLGS